MDTNDFISVVFLNHEGGGYAARTRVRVGTTLGQFILTQMGNININDMEIRVNGLISESDTVLNDGDRVSVSPLKIAGN